MEFDLWKLLLVLSFKLLVVNGNVADFLRNSKLDDPRPPVILIPGMISSRLVAWKQKKCLGSTIEVQDIVWLNVKNVVETVTFDKNCWMDCLKLDKNGTDPIDCKLRPDEGISSVSELAPGSVLTAGSTSIYTPLINLMAKELSYDANNIIGAPYDWRLSPKQMELRDSYFTNLKFKIESAVQRHGRPAVVIAFSMGNLLFQYFIAWLEFENKPPMGHVKWLRKHIWGYVGVAAPLLGAAVAVKTVLSGHTFGIPITDAQARDLLLTCPSTLYLNPKSEVYDRKTYFPNASANADDIISKPHKLNFLDPIVSINGTGYGTPSNAANDSNNNSSSSTSSSHREELQFNISDVRSGSMFDKLTSDYPDTQLGGKLEDLKALYHEDPLLDLLKSPYVRPPIRHVFMIYGVDIPTEIGYNYYLQNNTAIAEAALKGPSMPEWLQNALPPHLLEKVETLKGSLPSTVSSSAATSESAATTTSTTAAATTTSNGSKTTAATNGKTNVLGGVQLPVFNPLVLNETIMEDSSCNSALNRKNARVFHMINTTATSIAVNKTAVAEKATAECLNARSTRKAKSDKKSADQAETKHETKTVESKAVSIAGTEIPDPFKSLSSFFAAAEPQAPPPKCGTKLYAVKSLSNASPLEFLTTTAANNKRYIHDVNQKQPHSGDGTVPYVSLSYAKTWLNSEENSPGAEYNWKGDPEAGDILAMKERIYGFAKKIQEKTAQEKSGIIDEGKISADENSKNEDESRVLKNIKNLDDDSVFHISNDDGEWREQESQQQQQQQTQLSDSGSVGSTEGVAELNSLNKHTEQNIDEALNQFEVLTPDGEVEICTLCYKTGIETCTHKVSGVTRTELKGSHDDDDDSAVDNSVTTVNANVDSSNVVEMTQTITGDTAAANSATKVTSPTSTAATTKKKRKGKAREWHEKHPARLHKHFLNDWVEVFDTVDPAVEIFRTTHENGDTTAVAEVSGLDHLEVLKSPYVHELMFKALLQLMHDDLHLE